MASDHRTYQGDSPSVGNYWVGVEIGRGSFATVYKGYHKQTHKTVAIKSVSRSKLTKKLQENLKSEITILKGIRHNHIVQLVDCKESDTHIHLIMEYCSMGDLSSYIKRRGELNGTSKITAPGTSPQSPTAGLDEYVVLHFLKQLANALEFLRSQNLIHRDIKPQNLLLLPPPDDKEMDSIIGSPDYPILKIADFGFARWLPSTSMAETLCGSPLYMAPEILRYEKYDAKADLWSVGAVLYEMCVGKPPFRAANHVDLLRKIEKGRDRIKFPGEPLGVVQTNNLHPGTQKVSFSNTSGRPLISEELKDLIRQLLKRNPVERISFEEFFMHPCVAGELKSFNTSIMTTKDRLVHESQNRSNDIMIQANDIHNNYDNKNLNVRDRSISSPAPLHYKDNEIGINHQMQPVQTYSKANFSRKEIEGLSQKGTTIARTTDVPAHLQSKTSRDSVKNQQIYQRSSRYSPNTTNASLSPYPSHERLAEPSMSNELQLPSGTPSPSPSLLVQERDEEPSRRHTYSGNDNVDRKAKRTSHAEEDVFIEKEYVVVEEKGTIEVNALADELAASPKSTGMAIRNSTKGGTTFPAGPPTSNITDAHYRASTQNTNPSVVYFYSTTPPFAMPHNTHERSSTGNNGSGSSALARALSIATERLFGTGNSPPSWSDKYSKTSGNALSIGSDAVNDPEEEAVIKTIEDIARKAFVVSQFADTKFYKLLPPPPSATNELSDGAPIPSEVATVLAEEALVLYVKALTLLKAAMDNAKQYWAGIGDRQTDHSGVKVASHRLNNAVQWIRARYNECLDRAEYAKSRCIADDENNVGGAVPEKLLYDRALEMSRQAAINEHVNEDLSGCERAYQTAIDTLNAILEGGMDEDDQQIVNKFINSINNRLKSVQKKLAQAEAVNAAGVQGSPG